MFSQGCIIVIPIPLEKLLERMNNQEPLNPMRITGLTHVQLIQLAESLKNSKTLEKLYLRDNKIDVAGSIALAEALKTNDALQTLDLGYNLIDDDGAIALAEALKVNKKLRCLNLVCCRISTKGAIAIAEALVVNTALQELGLSFNMLVGDHVARAFSQLLITNKTLQKIDLSDTCVAEDEIAVLQKALDANSARDNLILANNFDMQSSSVAAPPAKKVKINDSSNPFTFDSLRDIASKPSGELISIIGKQLQQLVNDEGDTVWHSLAKKGGVCCVTLKGAIDAKEFDQNSLKNNYGENVWHCLAKTDSPEALHALEEAISDGTCDPNITDNVGNTVWHCLSKNSNSNALRTLERAMGSGACDPNITDKSGNTVWHSLARGGHYYRPLKDAIDAKLFDPNSLKNNKGETIWHCMAKYGHVKALEEAIRNGQCDPNVTDNAGNTLWHCLAKAGHYDGPLRDAINAKLFDPNSLKNNYGETVWHCLAQADHIRALKALEEAISSGFCDPTVVDKDGNTVWHCFVLYGAEVLRDLVNSKGFYQNTAKNKNGETVWHCMAKTGHTKAVAALCAAIKAGKCDPNIKGNIGNTVWHYWAKTGNSKALKALREAIQEKRCNPDMLDNVGKSVAYYLNNNVSHEDVVPQYYVERSDWPFYFEFSKSNYTPWEELKIALIRNILNDVKDDNGNTIFHMMAAEGRYYKLRELIQQGICNPSAVNANRCNILHILAKRRDYAAVQYEIENPVQVPSSNGKKEAFDLCLQNRVGETVLHILAEQCNDPGHINWPLILSKWPTVIKMQDGADATILHYLALHGYDIVLNLKELLDSNKDVLDVRDIDGATMWHRLAKSGNYMALARAIDGGYCNLTAADNDGNTIWHYLAESGNIGALEQAILDGRFVPDTLKNKAGATVYHSLAKGGHCEALIRLISSGKLDPAAVKDNYGATILHYLGLYGNRDLLKNIINRQAFGQDIEDNAGNTAFYYLAKSGNITALNLAITAGDIDPDKKANGDDLWLRLYKDQRYYVLYDALKIQLFRPTIKDFIPLSAATEGSDKVSDLANDLARIKWCWGDDDVIHVLEEILARKYDYSLLDKVARVPVAIAHGVASDNTNYLDSANRVVLSKYFNKTVQDLIKEKSYHGQIKFLLALLHYKVSNKIDVYPVEYNQQPQPAAITPSFNSQPRQGNTDVVAPSCRAGYPGFDSV